MKRIVEKFLRNEWNPQAIKRDIPHQIPFQLFFFILSFPWHLLKKFFITYYNSIRSLLCFKAENLKQFYTHWCNQLASYGIRVFFFQMLPCTEPTSRTQKKYTDIIIELNLVIWYSVRTVWSNSSPPEVNSKYPYHSVLLFLQLDAYSSIVSEVFPCYNAVTSYTILCTSDAR